MPATARAEAPDAFPGAIRPHAHALVGAKRRARTANAAATPTAAATTSTAAAATTTTTAATTTATTGAVAPELETCRRGHAMQQQPPRARPVGVGVGVGVGAGVGVGVG